MPFFALSRNGGKYLMYKNSILPTKGGKGKNAQNHRQIDARGEAEVYLVNLQYVSLYFYGCYKNNATHGKIAFRKKKGF